MDLLVMAYLVMDYLVMAHFGMAYLVIWPICSAPRRFFEHNEL